MRVFISWSGEPSRSIARALNSKLPLIVQHIDTWMSDEEIKSGTRWNEAIATALDETDYGIVCVTRTNQHAPWLIFEAGALAKSVQAARLVPLCIDLPSTDVTGPLAAFQGRSLDQDGVRRLVYDLSAASEKNISTAQLDEVFDSMWPKLEDAVADAIARAPKRKQSGRTTDDMLREVVDAVRSLERSVASRNTEEVASATSEIESRTAIPEPTPAQATGARPPRPGSSGGRPRPRTPRPGNNPFAFTESTRRPGTPRPGTSQSPQPPAEPAD